jgi:hypothetical protein
MLFLYIIEFNVNKVTNIKIISIIVAESAEIGVLNSLITLKFLMILSGCNKNTGFNKDKSEISECCSERIIFIEIIIKFTRTGVIRPGIIYEIRENSNPIQKSTINRIKHRQT